MAAQPTGNVVFFANGQALGQPVPLEVVNGQAVATLTTTLSTPGTFTLTAVYGGDSTHSASSSNPINDVVHRASRLLTPPPGPLSSLSSGLAVIAPHRQSCSSSTRLWTRPAQTTANYTILTVGLNGQFGKGSKRIAVKSAIYNAGSQTVTLHTSRPLKAGQRYQLTLNGASAGGLASSRAAFCSRHRREGAQGSDYVATLARQDYVVESTRSGRQGTSDARCGRRRSLAIRAEIVRNRDQPARNGRPTGDDRPPVPWLPS